jgi:hypothetical protein
LGTLISPFLVAWSIFQIGAALATIGSNGGPLVTFLLVEIAASAALFFLSIVAIVLLWKHHRNYPLVFTGLLLANAVLAVVDYEGAKVFGVSMSAEDTNQLWRAIIGALIWIAYMAKSKRVQNTFVK